MIQTTVEVKVSQSLKRFIANSGKAQAIMNRELKIIADNEIVAGLRSSMKSKFKRYPKEFIERTGMRAYNNEVIVYIGHPGANIQDVGGTIRGMGKKLAIPMNEQAKAEHARTAYTAFNLVPIPIRGNTFLAQKIGKSIKLWYLLKKQVTLKAKHYARPVFHRIAKTIPRRLVAKIREEMLKG